MDISKGSDKISKTFINLVNKSVNQAETRLKVLGVPKEQICEVYNHLVNDQDKSIEDFDKLVKIRGFNKTEFDLSQIQINNAD
jgi:predicted secreted protein